MIDALIGLLYLMLGVASPATSPAPTSPAWQVPVYSENPIIDYGVVEYDTVERDMVIRLSIATPFGPDVLHSHSASLASGEVTLSAGMDRAVLPDSGAMLIQVWRSNIAPVNNGKLVSVWLKTKDGTVHFSALSGRGAGKVDYMGSFVDWNEPCCIGSQNGRY